ncbi:HicA-like toxin [Ruegeria phage RpAliso]|nr:HicA-like toxin [Ruegeria phage RpAliso]
MKNRKLIKEMKKRGWTYVHTGKGHLKFIYQKTGDFIFHPSTASDHRAEKNLMARVIRVEAQAAPA